MGRRHHDPGQRHAERELELALEEAARSADKHASKSSIARRVYNEHPSLIKAVTKVWVLERMERILDRLERHSASENQLTIPGIDLPPVIRLLKPDPDSRRKQKPQRIALLDCTRPQLLEYRKELLTALKSDKRIQEVDKALALMNRHARWSKKATLREVLEKHGQEILQFGGEVEG